MWARPSQLELLSVVRVVVVVVAALFGDSVAAYDAFGRIVVPLLFEASAS